MFFSRSDWATENARNESAGQSQNAGAENAVLEFATCTIMQG